jgi:hypothetical protein
VRARLFRTKNQSGQAADFAAEISDGAGKTGRARAFLLYFA